VSDPLPTPPPAPPAAPASTRGSALIAAGILSSRVSGLVREAVFTSFFSLSDHADIWRVAQKLPNFLQNLLGEGTLSASFIPVYARLLEEKRHQEAGQVAGAVFALLAVAAGTLALLGFALAPVFVHVFLFAWAPEKQALTIEIVRIVFPMTGLLVLSAWALGVLNSHRSFFLPYVAPVVWNAAIIAVLLVFGTGFGWRGDELVVVLAWGALLGGLLQLAVQLPRVRRLEPELRISWAPALPGVRETLKNAGPAVLGRGVVQVSGYLDTWLAQLLATGAVAAIANAQVLYMLPISLFGASVAAAELPELARQGDASKEALRARIDAGVERVAFYVVPSLVAFVALGDVIVAALFQHGKFGAAETRVVWFTLVGYAVGLLASTSTRLFSSAFYALRDTATPARIATVRVVVSAAVGFALMAQLEPFPSLGWEGGFLSDWTVEGLRLGAAGLAFGAGVAAWVEWFLLRRALAAKIGPVGARASVLARLFAAAFAGAAAGLAVELVLPPIWPPFAAIFVCGAFGVVYLGLTAAMGIGEAGAFVGKIRRRLRR
jgi:putative peptidoglycan lipid II flippase